MELRPGYKMTEVGVIPEEWEVKYLGSLASVVRGGSPRPAGDPRYFNGDYIPWLTVAALTNIPDHQQQVRETFGSLTEEGARRSRVLENGTLIIANSGATLGVAKLLEIRCCANDGIAALVDQRSGDGSFLCSYLNTQTKRLRAVIATGNGQPNLNTGLIKGIPVPFPADYEQQTIAGTLGDVDALLRALERLIAKKRDLKQAAMEQLLTGQTRLPGFRGQWNVVTLDEIVRLRKTHVDSSADDSNGFCIELEHIEPSTGRLLGETRTSASSSLKSTFLRDDVLFGKLRAYLRKHWLADRNGVCSTEIWVMTSEPAALVPNFLFQLVKTNAFVEAASSSYGTHMPRSDWKVLRSYEVWLPSITEQHAIATVLNDMDSEIAAFEHRLAKTGALKQGMMQELLTGRIRLVHP